MTLPSPQQPAFFIGSRTERSFPTKEFEFSDKSTSKSMPWSVDEASITEYMIIVWMSNDATLGNQIFHYGVVCVRCRPVSVCWVRTREPNFPLRCSLCSMP
ncbi:hypothetical protein AB3S75_005471 [Citrus x aurantiifolia]